VQVVVKLREKNNSVNGFCRWDICTLLGY